MHSPMLKGHSNVDVDDMCTCIMGLHHDGFHMPYALYNSKQELSVQSWAYLKATLGSGLV